MTEPLLVVEGLSRSYAGVRAVDRLNLSVGRGTITGLIGPNGCGKSTTIDCISGLQAADAGRWSLDGQDLTGASPEDHARAGLIRTFQMVRSYDDLTVLDNLLVAVQDHQGHGWWAAFLRSPAVMRAERRARAEALSALGRVGLADYADAPAQVLSYGQRKLLSIAALIVARPRLAILDEPVSGINAVMIERVVEAIRALNRDGTAVLLVEHNMDVISALCDHVVVMVGGRLLMQGPPAAVRSDPRVLEAYLGSDVLAEPAA